MSIPIPVLSLKKRYTVAIHVAVWLIFGIWIFYLASSKQTITLGKALDVLVGLLFPVGIFYFNWYVLISKYLARNKIFLYISAVVATLFALALIQAPIDYYIFRKYNPSMEALYSTDRIIQYMVSGLVVVFISSALKVTGNYIRNERLNKELETQKLTAELAYLKSQVNPHFLFNTLNNIYSLAYKQSPDTPDAIMKLSLLMRYMLYESNDTLVSLDKEVDHIKNFIDLQKLRLREQTSIKFNIEGDLAGKQIAPMLLMTLVENAFKHGLVSKNEIGIILNLTVEHDRLVFSTVNNTSTHKKREFGGIGLENLKRRLNLLYPERHKLTFEEKDGTFYATLKIFFQQKP
ncbi:sensor histidine kinase [Pontibacter cellulosilyticus]|uniref:Sensor histidine kinase n=1 Tax=Pontibacter cellulosilyticus TaxID=1720253 RepID=A0A923SH70_9BACT|nr:sensor histidine kinase [Pontibacter cellulosilyticus]MBC5991373.1 sensor histidine kinase [Pontibacter cellulosilyticus]